MHEEPNSTYTQEVLHNMEVYGIVGGNEEMDAKFDDSDCSPSSVNSLS